MARQPALSSATAVSRPGSSSCAIVRQACLAGHAPHDGKGCPARDHLAPVLPHPLGTQIEQVVAPGADHRRRQARFDDQGEPAVGRRPTSVTRSRSARESTASGRRARRGPRTPRPPGTGPRPPGQRRIPGRPAVGPASASSGSLTRSQRANHQVSASQRNGSPASSMRRRPVLRSSGAVGASLGMHPPPREGFWFRRRSAPRSPRPGECGPAPGCFRRWRRTWARRAHRPDRSRRRRRHADHDPTARRLHGHPAEDSSTLLKSGTVGNVTKTREAGAMGSRTTSASERSAEA